MATHTTPADRSITVRPESDLLSDSLGLRNLAVSFSAVVEGAADNGNWLVRCGEQRFAAQLAFGCLVEPALGDHVACWRSAGAAPMFVPTGADNAESVLILSVLHRPGTQPQRLVLQAQAEVQAGSLKVSAEQCELSADSTTLIYRTLSSFGQLCKLTVGQLKLAGQALSTVFDQQMHHAKNHQRCVEGIDRVKAQVIEQQADELMHLQGPTVLTDGDKLVKTRGAQIHFG